MFPPTFKKWLGHEIKHNPPNVRSSYTTGRHLNRMNRLDNSYPLADLEVYRQENKAPGSGSRASSFRIEQSTDSRAEIDPYSVIGIR